MNLITSSPRVARSTRGCKGNEDKRFQEESKSVFNQDFKNNRSEKFCVDKWTEFAGEFKKFLNPKEYKFFLQWVRSRLSLMKVQYYHLKNFFTVTWKTMCTSNFTRDRSVSQLWILEKIIQLMWNQKMSEMPTFCPLLTTNL